MIPASTSIRSFHARESGKAVMAMVEQNIRPSQIMTRQALENTVTLLGAIGGSLNRYSRMVNSARKGATLA